MMRKLLLVGALIAGPSLAQAAVITETGQLISGGQSTENGYILVYSFAPFTVSGEITNFQLAFTGFISAMVGGATGINISTGNTITSVTVTPSAAFASSLLSGPTLGFPGNVTFTGIPTVEVYDNSRNISVSPSAQAVTLIGNSGPGVPSDTFNIVNRVAVDLFASPYPLIVNEPTGSTAYFPGGTSIDRSSGIGNLLLTVTYNSIPEPASAAALGMSLLGLFRLRRSRSV